MAVASGATSVNHGNSVLARVAIAFNVDTTPRLRRGVQVDVIAADIQVASSSPATTFGTSVFAVAAEGNAAEAYPPGVSAKDPALIGVYRPVFAPPEDLLLAIIRPLEDELPGLKVRTIIEDDLFTCPYVMIHAGTGSWVSDSFANADNRFWRRVLADVQVWTDGPDAEEKAWYLHELVRRKIQRAFDMQTVYPGLGHVAGFRTNSPAHKTPDWATATGVNQYANLPKGMVRYQAMYGMAMRPPKGANQIEAADLAAFILS